MGMLFRRCNNQQRNFTGTIYQISRQIAFVLSVFVSISWLVENDIVKALLNLILLVLFLCSSKLFEKKINRISVSYVFFYLVIYLVYSVCACYYTKERILAFDQTGFQDWDIRDYYYTYFIGIFLVYLFVIIYLTVLPKCKQIGANGTLVRPNDSRYLLAGGVVLAIGFFLTGEADIIIPGLSTLLCYVIVEKKKRVFSLAILCICAVVFRDILLSRFKFIQIVFPVIILFCVYSNYNRKRIKMGRVYGLLLIGMLAVGIYGTVSEVYKLNTSYGMDYNIMKVLTSWESMLLFFEKQLYRVTAIWIKLGGYILYHTDQMEDFYWGLTFIKSLSVIFDFEYVSLPIISAGYNYSSYAQPGLFAEGYANFGILGATLNICIVFLFMEFTRREFYKNQTISNFLLMTVPFTKIILDGGSLNSAILIYLVLTIGTIFGNFRTKNGRFYSLYKLFNRNKVREEQQDYEVSDMRPNPLVSVVIPVYNVEKYLEACIDSILQQTYEKIEIILVDDGSTDSCGKICDEYASKDSRLKVLHKGNGGLSSARNAGIKVATGEWITFIDSDDYISEVYIEQLVKGLREDIEVVICNMSDVETELSHSIIDTAHRYSAHEALRYILSETVLNTSACAKLFRTCLFEEIKFPEGKIYEDYATIPKIIANINGVLHYESALYFYRPNPASITGVQFSEKRMQYFEISDAIEQFIHEHKPDFVRLVAMRKTRYAISFYRQIRKSKYENQKVENYLSTTIKDNIIPYIFSTQYSLFSKAYGLLIVICPKLTKIVH